MRPVVDLVSTTVRSAALSVQCTRDNFLVLSHQYKGPLVPGQPVGLRGGRCDGRTRQNGEFRVPASRPLGCRVLEGISARRTASDAPPWGWRRSCGVAGGLALPTIRMALPKWCGSPTGASAPASESGWRVTLRPRDGRAPRRSVAARGSSLRRDPPPPCMGWPRGVVQHPQTYPCTPASR